MFHMHTSFDLAAEVNIDDYRITLNQFSSLMKENGLIVATGPVLERCHHPIMDTDEHRGHQYFFVISFTDREQCDAAVRHIQASKADSDSVHRAIYRDIIQPIFSCWVDPL
jgi:hypothetical protein